MTPCEEKGYEVGQVFERVTNSGGEYCAGDILALIEHGDEDGAKFLAIHGKTKGKEKFHFFSRIRRIYPPEKETVSITCEGKTVEISRESAKALKLI